MSDNHGIIGYECPYCHYYAVQVLSSGDHKCVHCGRYVYIYDPPDDPDAPYRKGK